MSSKTMVFLDSGAYSAMSKGATIDIDEYIAFIQKHEPDLEAYVCLDVIGSAEKSWEAQQYMVSKGLCPIPVYHLNDRDLSFLTKMVDQFPYIGIGGMTGTEGTGFSLTIEQVLILLDDIFSKYICDKDGFPKVKVHGFGMTRPYLMRRYPWYSVDSTSWAMYSKYGIVLVPKFTQGKYVYDQEIWKVKVSSVSPGLKEVDDHIDTMSEIDREVLLKYLNSIGFKLGRSSFKEVKSGYKLKGNERFVGKGKVRVEIIEEEGLCNSGHLRDMVNLTYYMDFVNTIPKWPWSFKPTRRLF